MLFAACAGSNGTGNQAGLHNDGSATADDSGGGHWTACQSSVSGQTSVLG